MTNAPQVAMNERQSDVCGAINVNDNFECDNNGGGIENASLQESIERQFRTTNGGGIEKNLSKDMCATL